MRFEIVNYEGLPPNLKDTRYSNYFNSFQYASFLLIYDRDEEVIFYVSDKMEPEDACFSRDLSWVTKILQDMFEAGLDEGHREGYSYSEGYTKGYDEGYQDGLAADIDDGKNDPDI